MRISRTIFAFLVDTAEERDREKKKKKKLVRSGPFRRVKNKEESFAADTVEETEPCSKRKEEEKKERKWIDLEQPHQWARLLLPVSSLFFPVSASTDLDFFSLFAMEIMQKM